ncbi:Tol-Pal system protein TolB [Pseudoalteromonas holothuriae]|uniref:Tol-Pal system protein TolB n=1 Tax=Pseudoalteromonas holothuriae TaxID=2963714 RepID=A0ABN8UI30_9GAMM|nr:Tol-Pal system protein TolB [Pseudoalteromonas sp. CIP111951]
MTHSHIFFINEFKIDLSRCVIIHANKYTKVEPKVLKVLQVLAQNQQQVVTHQVLMKQVWQGSEVVPNALQRCIAILRKTLNDDAKAPSIIATHPKMGYSLMAQVKWQDDDNEHARSNHHIASISNAKGLLLPFALLLILAVLAFVFWPNSHPSAYTNITALTQTDAHESDAVFSPNAQYVVFNRYAGACKSHIWAKELSTKKETQLTAIAGQFGALSFTPDGRELVFTTHNACDKKQPVAQPSTKETLQTCWAIATLDFAKAFGTPQTPQHRYQCQTNRLQTPKALGNHQYAFLRLDNKHNQLMHYKDLNKSLKALYSNDSDTIYHFDYHEQLQMFALFSQNNNAEHQLTLLNKAGQVQQQTVLPSSHWQKHDQLLTGNFAPNGKYLLAANNGKLYKITFDGQITHIPSPSHNLVSVTQHPNKRELLAVQGTKDIDIANINLNSQTLQIVKPELNTVATPYPSLARTHAQERLARFQPNGHHIAFISNRNDLDTLWLWHPSNLQPLALSNNTNAVNNYSWSPDGSHLAWASNGTLTISNLKGKHKAVNTRQPIYVVLDWFQKDKLLVLSSSHKPRMLHQLDLKHNTLIPYPIHNAANAWAQQNQLIYTTTQGAVFSRSLIPSKTGSQPLHNLNAKALVVTNEHIYSVDNITFALNQYTPNGTFIKTLKALKPTAWKITDIKNQQLLLEQFIAIEQEVVVLE